MTSEQRAARLAALGAAAVLLASLFLQWYRLKAGDGPYVPRRYISLTAWHVFSATDALIAVAAISGLLFAAAALVAPLGRGTMLLPEALALAALGAIVFRLLHVPPPHYHGNFLVLFGPDLHLKPAYGAYVGLAAALGLLGAEVWVQRAAGGEA